MNFTADKLYALLPAIIRIRDSESGEPLLRLRFTLGPGVYATALLREVLKNDDLAGLASPLHPPVSGASAG